MPPEDVNRSQRLYDGKIPSTIEDCNPLRRRILLDIADAIQEEYEFDDESTVIMDFACGTGLVSQQLAPYCKEIIGVDNDPSIVEHYNRIVANQGIPSDEMRAVCGDENTISLDGKLFDVIVCAQAYHHFESIENTTIALSTHLRPGGVLIIIDHLRPPYIKDQQPVQLHEGMEYKVAHPGGFSEAQITATIEAAGLRGISVRPFTQFRKRGQVCEMFIAKGEKVLSEQ